MIETIKLLANEWMLALSELEIILSTHYPLTNYIYTYINLTLFFFSKLYLKSWKYTHHLVIAQDGFEGT